jgi:hypothetical protein
MHSWNIDDKNRQRADLSFPEGSNNGFIRGLTIPIINMIYPKPYLK